MPTELFTCIGNRFDQETVPSWVAGLPSVQNMTHWSMRLSGEPEGSVFMAASGEQPIDFGRWRRSVSELPATVTHAAIDFEPRTADGDHIWTSPYAAWTHRSIPDDERELRARMVGDHLFAANRLLTIAQVERPDIDWQFYGIFPTPVRAATPSQYPAISASDFVIGRALFIERASSIGVSCYRPAPGNWSDWSWESDKARMIDVAKATKKPVAAWVWPIRHGGGGWHSMEDWERILQFLLSREVDRLIFWCSASPPTTLDDGRIVRAKFDAYVPYIERANDLVLLSSGS